MLRSNTKKAIENIKGYIMENFNIEYFELDEKPQDFATAAEMIMHAFVDEYGKHHNGNIQENFISWCQGLPSAIDTCYYYNRSAVDDLGNILDETETEKSRFSESDSERMLSCLIYRELLKACKYQIK